eukprot:10327924-Alexandrium_andersonii.AAC.1
MGSRVALAKCKTMSTHPDVRAELRLAKYGQQGEEVPVVHSMRDLGSHLTVSGRGVGPTLSERLAEATK